MTEDDDLDLDVRSPQHGETFRINPDPKYREDIVMINDDKLYKIEGEALKELERLAPDKLKYCTLFLAQNTAGVCFLWPVEKPIKFDHPAMMAMDVWVTFEGLH